MLCGPPQSVECAENLSTLLALCEHLGVLLAAEEPSSCLTFMGNEIDTEALEVQMKLSQLIEEVRAWADRQRCTKRELLSLAGKLQHASTVVRSGRTFVRRLFDLSTRVNAQTTTSIKLYKAGYSMVGPVP